MENITAHFVSSNSFLSVRAFSITRAVLNWRDIMRASNSKYKFTKTKQKRKNKRRYKLY